MNGIKSGAALVAALIFVGPAAAATLTIQDTFNQGSNGSPMTDPSNSWANIHGSPLNATPTGPTTQATTTPGNGSGATSPTTSGGGSTPK